MKVLSLSLDRHVLNEKSVVASRSIRYGKVLEAFTVIVPSTDAVVVKLSEHTVVYGTGGSFKLLQLIRMYKIASKLMRTQRYDVVSSQDTYFLGLLAVVLGRLFHCGVEIQVLGIEKLSFLRKQLSLFVLQRAGSIRVLSTGLLKRLHEEFKLSQERMKLVPIYVDVSSLGFNEASLTPEKRQLMHEAQQRFIKAYGERFNIVSVNRLVPIKNIDMQISAIAQLKEKYPHILLHIVGDGPLQFELEARVASFGLQDHVRLEGYRAGVELNAFFTQSDCFVLTSDFEGYGMVVIEAATAGLPIVMTDVGCAGEVIVDQKSGIVVPPRDTAAFTSGIEKIITDGAFARQLREGALQSIAELPSFDTVLEQYLSSWQQALQNKS